MTPPRSVLFAIAFAIAGACVDAQTTFTPFPGQPPMAPPGGGRGQLPAGNNPELPPGTAVLRGRVFAADTGQPLRKAQVRITQTDVATAPGVIRDNKLATTDARGLFEFKELRAGRYTLMASKGSYVSLQYGQARPTEPGKPIEILDGQTIERVDFALPHGGIITGRILDEFGEPLAEVIVSPQRFQYMQGQRRLVGSGRSVVTDDLGEFRLFGVPPGQYYLQATFRSGVIFGAGQETGYAPMFFPGTLDVASAQRITIGVGTDVSGVVMTMKPVKAAKVSGTVMDSQGRPMSGMLMVMQATGNNIMTMGGPVRPDGSFSLNGLAPGEYTLRSQQIGRSPAESEVALLRITVGSEDITDLQLFASPPSIVRGRVLVDPAAASALPARLMVAATPVQPMIPNPPAAVAEDLTFELRAVPGAVRITLGGGASGWSVRSVRVNGADVTDSGFEVKAREELSGVEVELTNKLTTITGLVTNARGGALKDYSTIVFAQDPARWGLTTNRYQSIGRPDQDGRFKISGLPAGEYYIIALDRVDTGEVYDPEYLEKIRAKASSISINEGETKQLELKVQTGT